MSEETQQPEEQQENDAPQVEENTPPNEQVEPVNDGDFEIPHEAQASNPESLTERPALAEPGDFDWNAFEADVDDYSAEDRASLEVAYENSLNLLELSEIF